MFNDEKLINEIIQETIQKQAEDVARKTKKKLEYYKKYPFLYKSFFYESKFIPDFPCNWFLISSFDEFTVLADMYGDLYRANVPLLTREYDGEGFYGVNCDMEFTELQFYKLDNYINEMLQMREKMTKLSN